VFINRAFGPYWWAYWTMITCNVVSPQLFWFKAMRQSPLVIFIVATFVTIGMWFERFVIIVTSLHRAWLPGEWHMFHPTFVDIMTFAGTFGIFLTLFLLFLRVIPVFAMAELKAVLPQADPHGHADGHGHDSHGHEHGKGH
jgi:molybdopterin-containing oxidoreductase family membrane subunit